MKVHVVCHELDGDQVLARLVRTLLAHTTWTAGTSPDPRADVNYFFPYLMWKPFSEFKRTLTAAWFTHRDDPHPGKVTTWERAARSVDLRLTSARLYLPGLSEYGAAHVVTPPVEADKFRPSARDKQGKPRVGVAGMVYAGGRKGERLVSDLLQSPLGRHLDVRAAGRDWSCPTRMYDWGELQTFYQGLDVFVCTSLIEGIPMPPLEALACGVPVVIPRAVGLLDDLPECDGIYRYDVGSFGGMCEALETALTWQGDAMKLRSVIAPYAGKAWAEDHAQAFEGLLSPRQAVNLPRPTPDNAGAYYVAYGVPARKCAATALAAWQNSMPYPAALASDVPLNAGESVFIPVPDEDVGARLAKIRIYDHAPAAWVYVLYMDADTEVVADVSFLFDALADGWELVICKNPGKYHVAREMVRPDNREECQATFEALGSEELIQLNGGVFGFRRCARVEAFFRRWHDEWQRWGKRDQAALLRALYADPLRVLVLGNEWNTVTRYDSPGRTAGILHYPTTARRWDGPLWDRLDSREAWKRVVK